MQRFGRADILINNAGILRTGSLEEFDLSELRPMIAINYESIVRSCYLFARAMKAAGSGQIINVSSIGANITAAGVGVYGGLKSALEMFTDSLRIELRSEEHTSELQSIMRISYAVFWLKKKNNIQKENY